MSLANWWKKRQERKRIEEEHRRELFESDRKVMAWMKEERRATRSQEPAPTHIAVDDSDDLFSDVASAVIVGEALTDFFSGDSISGSGLSDSDSFSGGGGSSGGGGATGDW